MPRDQTALTNLRPTPFGPTVMLPNSTTIQATHAGQLPFHPSFSDKAKTAHVLDDITNSSLISIGQLCHDDCIAVLDKKLIKIFKNQECILMGQRNTTDGLWDIIIHPSNDPLPRPPAPQHQINAIIHKDTSKTQLAQYLYGCCGSPALSTWKKAIKNGNCLTWPGIDTLSLASLPKSMASAKGHLEQERKNLQSTKLPLVTDDEDDNFFPLLPDTPNLKTFTACATIVPFVAKHTAYHSLTSLSTAMSIFSSCTITTATASSTVLSKTRRAPRSNAAGFTFMQSSPKAAINRRCLSLTTRPHPN
jgi:hypothetical protein